MIDDPILLNDWHPVASLAQLRQCPIRAVRLLGRELVVWQADQQIQVWEDLCIHRGARLSAGRLHGEQLACPYHGWRYGVDGRCVYIPAHPEQTPPAKATAQSYPVQVRYDMVWTCLGDPAQDIPHFAEWDDERFGAALCEPIGGVRANGPRIIENFLDAAHFPFVHDGVLGDPNQPQIGDYEAHIGPQGVWSDPVTVYQPDPYGGSSGSVQYIYHAYRPLTAHFTKIAGATTNGLLLVVTPHDELDSTAWFVVATTALRDRARLGREYTPRIAAIFEEDRAIVEGQRPELLPLDLQAELHLRSDRMAIAYRQWLKQLGLRYGAA